MPNLDKIITAMPKVELHAHLNGSISDALLEHLQHFANIANTSKTEDDPDIDAHGVLMKSVDNDSMLCDPGHDSELCKERSLAECWRTFSKIHQIIQTPAILYAATVNVIAQFSHDNVIYLELRTGPKKVHNIPSKHAYIETVVKGIKDAQRRFPITVKLLVSIDRKNGEQEALENLELLSYFTQQHPDILVGLDVSGDPNYGDSSWIIRVMTEARKKCLKISCHLPEIVNPEEAVAFLSFGPERLGHGQFLHPNYGGTTEMWKLAQEKRIPIETCITSNLVSGVTTSLNDHIVKIFQEESVLYLICTDDCGAFRTSLSNEFKKLAKIIKIDQRQLEILSEQAVIHAFAAETEKKALLHQINKWWREQQCSTSS